MINKIIIDFKRVIDRIITTNKRTIEVNVKLYSGLDKLINSKYNPDEGITLKIKQGSKIKDIATYLQLPDKKNLVSFCNYERVSLSKKLKNNDKIKLFRPSGGG